jgi:hypothetical protein
LLHEIDQPLGRAAQAVELPDHQRIVAAEVAEGLRQAGTCGLRARQGVRKEQLATCACERVRLQIEMLLSG